MNLRPWGLTVSKKHSMIIHTKGYLIGCVEWWHIAGWNCVFQSVLREGMPFQVFYHVFEFTLFLLDNASHSPMKRETTIYRCVSVFRNYLEQECCCQHFFSFCYFSKCISRIIPSIRIFVYIPVTLLKTRQLDIGNEHDTDEQMAMADQPLRAKYLIFWKFHCINANFSFC